MTDKPGGDLVECETCGTLTPEDEINSAWDIAVCAQCRAKFQAEVDACVHVWQPGAGDGDDAGFHCDRCGSFHHGAEMPPVNDPRQASLL